MDKVQVFNVDTQVEGSRLTGYLAKPPQPGPGVLVLHAWWGLNPFFKQLSDRLASEGFLVFAPDLNEGEIAGTIAEAEALMEARNSEQSAVTARSAVTFLKDQLAQQGEERFAKTGLGLVGFSMGASWSMVLASEMPEDVRAVVLFYGLEGVDIVPVRASFQGHFAEVDEWTESQWVDGLEKELSEANLPVEFHRYPGTGHWFFESDRPDAYNEAAAEQAYQRMVAFLRRELA